MMSDATIDKFWMFFSFISNSFRFILVAMMKESRCSCEVLWLLLLFFMFLWSLLFVWLVLLKSFHFVFRNIIFLTPAILALMQTVFPLTRALRFNYWNTSNHKERASRNFCKLDQCSLEGGELRASWVDYLENATRGVFFFNSAAKK